MDEMYIDFYNKLLGTYDDQFSVKGISGERVAERLSILAHIG